MKDNINQEEIWDKIAESWSENRQKPCYPEIAEFLKNKKGRILEIGCGNCRNLKTASKDGSELYGTDFSEKMIKAAKEYCKEHNMAVALKKADAAALPFADNFFDAVICIAVLHIIKGGKIEKPLNEIRRVLKPGATALISVWYKGEKREKLKAWPCKGKKIMRYYYFFDEKELADKVTKAGLKITKSYISGYKNRKNIFIEAKKPL